MTIMRLSDLHVIIAGAGTGGAAAALLFARSGARVTLLERVTRPRAVGAGIALAENGLAVLEAIGLGPAIHAHAREVGPARVVDATGRLLFDPPEPRPRIAMLRRSTLQGLLLDAVSAEPLIKRRFGTEVIDATADGEVRVRTNEGDIHLHGDLVIGADGVHSRVRSSGQFGAKVGRPGIAYVRALVPEGMAREEEAWTPAGLFGSFEVDGGTYLYASAGSPACREAAAAGDLDAFRRAWTAAYAPAKELLSTLRTWDDLIVNRVLRVECRQWFDGRLVLLGDAAHAMAPNLGQGANSALVDAAVLLDALGTQQSLHDALATYQMRRQPAVQKVATMSARLGSLAELTAPVPRFLRDRLLIPLLNRMASSKTNEVVLQERPDWLRQVGGEQRSVVSEAAS